MLESLYNTQICERNCVGYCKYHCRHLTVHQVKRKQCLKKQCNALEKRAHEYWRQREIKKAKKKGAMINA